MAPMATALESVGFRTLNRSYASRRHHIESLARAVVGPEAGAAVAGPASSTGASGCTSIVSMSTPGGAVATVTTARAMASGSRTPPWRWSPNRFQYASRSSMWSMSHPNPNSLSVGPTRTTVERIAAGPFANEAIAQIRNTQFVNFCRSVGDEGTAHLYAEVIQPEEAHHHLLGREYLENHLTTPELQELAAAAVRNTLAIADELRNLAAKTTGVHNIPVS